MSFALAVIVWVGRLVNTKIYKSCNYGDNSPELYLFSNYSIFFFEMVKTLKYTHRKWHTVDPQLYSSRSACDSGRFVTTCISRNLNHVHFLLSVYECM